MRRAPHGRALRAVVFLDTVGSTKIAAALGDERWQTLLRRELQILRKLLKARGGEEVDVAGDGLFAVFREPAPAVRYAASACEAVREIGLEIRAGVHFGEVEFADGRPAGMTVHTGARAMGLAGAGEVIVTQGVHDLLTGGHLGFEGQGTHELKGVPGSWALFRLTEVDDGPIDPPLTEKEAAERLRVWSESPPLVKRRAFLAATGAATLAVVGGVYFLRREPATSAQQPPPRTNRIFRYDLANNDLTMLSATFPDGVDDPCIAVGEGAVWTGDFYLHHVDPQDGSVREPISLVRANSDFVLAITTGFNDVWVVTPSGLTRIDAGDDQELDFRPLLLNGYQSSLVTAFDSVWVADAGGTVARVDPSNGLPLVRRWRVDGLPSGIVKAQDEIWISDGFGALIPIDPDLDRLEKPVQIAASPEALAATDDRLWATDPAGNVIVVDIESRTPRETIPVGGRPADVVAGLGAVWVADLEGRIVRIDTAQMRTDLSRSVGAPVAGLAIDEDAGLIWLRTTHHI
jgi:class 3 adenylate cyclase